MIAPRAIQYWIVGPLHDPSMKVSALHDRPSAPALLESLRTGAELQSVGHARFSGSRTHRSNLWLEYRNFLRQALSHYQAALGVDNRSAALLSYYAMLNFAKAELLSVNPTAVRGAVGHGLHFSPTRARSVAGDALTVTDGVFRLLYEHRTGHALPLSTRLPIRRLLARIPEMESQIRDVGLGPTKVAGVLNVTAADSSSAWTLLAIDRDNTFSMGTASVRLLARIFQTVEAPPTWRHVFGLSVRAADAVSFYESRIKFPHDGLGTSSLGHAMRAAQVDAWRARDLLEPSTSAAFDAWLSPSLYGARILPMPPSLARYAVTYYASSLVRYRPSMFDAQVSPEHAYLFDALGAWVGNRRQGGSPAG